MSELLLIFPPTFNVNSSKIINHNFFGNEISSLKTLKSELDTKALSACQGTQQLIINTTSNPFFLYD